MRARRPALLALPLLIAPALLAGPAVGQEAGAVPTAEERAAQPAVGAVRNILPPGSRGKYTATDVAVFQATGQRPANTVDQLALYDKLNTLAPSEITDATLQELFKDGALGVDPADVVGEPVRPREGVTVLRDTFGVPHVYGVTDADTAFGAGYVGTQDRMFLQDALRHVGAARLAEFLGPSAGNIASDRAQLRVSPYTVEEAERQITDLPKRYPGEGEELQRRLDGFLEGINLAQRQACPVPGAPSCPAEYAALQVVPRDWTRADVVYVASLVGGIFGGGGGAEYDNAVFLRKLQAELGEGEAREVFDDLMSHDDPEAPTTTARRFPYHPEGPGDPAAIALPDLGAETAPGSGNPLVALPAGAEPADPGVRTLDGPLGPIVLDLKSNGMSNAVLVSADGSDNGHPLAVFGPQVSYFAPQIVTEVDLHGPRTKARGASFPGTQFVVELGHGVDYAWSATSAGSDVKDIVAEDLCEPDGGEPTVESTHYRDAVGACVPFDRYVHREVAKPSPGGLGVPQVLEFEVLRTRHGIVQLRTLSDGRPVAYVLQRSTYGGEFDSAVGFMRINDPTYVQDAEDFERAFAAVDYTFNWFYVDDTDAAYFSSGLLPLRAPGTDPRLPRRGDARYDWRGFLDHDGHPQDLNPPSRSFISWNNKTAPGFNPGDGQNAYGPVYRSLSLSDRLAPLLAQGRRTSLPEITGVMIDAATVDPRGEQLLPEVLAAVGEDSERATELALLREWQASGANRVDRDRDGAYAHQSAIALFDAWYEDLAKTVLRPVLGDLVDEVPGRIDDHPRVTPGGFNAVGWYGYVDKDLRQVLGRPVAGSFSRTYCGNGSLEQCRADLRASLDRAVATLAEQQGTDDPEAWTYDKSQDRIRSQAVGLVGVPAFDFQNRPTFQQVVSFTRGRTAAVPPRAAPPAPAAVGARPASGALPATGLPVGLALLAGVALAGVALLRRGTGR